MFSKNRHKKGETIMKKEVSLLIKHNINFVKDTVDKKRKGKKDTAYGKIFVMHKPKMKNTEYIKNLYKYITKR